MAIIFSTSRCLHQATSAHQSGGKPSALQFHQASWTRGCINFTNILDIWKEGLRRKPKLSIAVSTTSLVLSAYFPGLLFSLAWQQTSQQTLLLLFSKGSAHIYVLLLSHLLSHHSILLEKIVLLFKRNYGESHFLLDYMKSLKSLYIESSYYYQYYY